MLPLCKPQIPQGLVLDRTRAVICRKLTAWSMERSLKRKIKVNCAQRLSSYLRENTLLPLGRHRSMLLREIIAFFVVVAITGHALCHHISKLLPS
jgi:hypothetical protein